MKKRLEQLIQSCCCCCCSCCRPLIILLFMTHHQLALPSFCLWFHPLIFYVFRVHDRQQQKSQPLTRHVTLRNERDVEQNNTLSSPVWNIFVISVHSSHLSFALLMSALHTKCVGFCYTIRLLTSQWHKIQFLSI